MDTYEYDAALLQLERPITFRGEIRRICLPDANLIVPDNMECVTTGWGRTRGKIPLHPLFLNTITSQLHCSN